MPDFRSRSLRTAREAIGLPADTRWDDVSYESEVLAEAAKYAELAAKLMRAEVERRTSGHTQQLPHMRTPRPPGWGHERVLKPAETRDLREQRQTVRNTFTEPSEAECSHGNRPGECEDC